jgi:hypothetical protein
MAGRGRSRKYYVCENIVMWVAVTLKSESDQPLFRLRVICVVGKAQTRTYEFAELLDGKLSRDGITTRCEIRIKGNESCQITFCNSGLLTVPEFI